VQIPGRTVQDPPVSAPADVEARFEPLLTAHAEPLVVCPDRVTLGPRQPRAAFTGKHRLTRVFAWQEDVGAGGRLA
jgi:hypothetical protein